MKRFDSYPYWFSSSRTSGADSGAVTSLSLQCLTANRVAACVPNCSPGLLSNIPLGVNTTRRNLCVHLPPDGRWACFQGLVVLNKASVNIHIKVFVWRHGAISLTQTAECVSVGSDGGSMFNFTTNRQTGNRLLVSVPLSVTM